MQTFIWLAPLLFFCEGKKRFSIKNGVFNKKIMFVKLACFSLHGVDAFRVDLEVDLFRKGLPGFTMVGLAEISVRESKERVFSALKNCGHRLPPSRITVNLAPADQKKQGSAYDLPLALGLVAAAGSLDPGLLDGVFISGELSLAGEVRPVPGILPMAILAKKENAKALLVPFENGREAAMVNGLKIFAVKNLGEALEALTGNFPEFVSLETESSTETSPYCQYDFAEVKGQEHAKRAIEIAAAGGHNLLFMGPPGSGKTMLAQRIPSVLPALVFEEALEVSKIYSVAGQRPAQPHFCEGLAGERPFRSPHHTISYAGLAGGGSSPKPGEVSLAHGGVLFLDELPEFSRSVLEVLRQPLESGEINISRSGTTACYPARFMLVAAMNPCPCGYLDDNVRSCTCTGKQVQNYRARISGPLLDRIDLHIEVPAVPYGELRAPLPGMSSAEMRDRITKARKVQSARYSDIGILTNAELSGKRLEDFCPLPESGHKFLETAAARFGLSARSCVRIVRIARTIADLEQKPHITDEHLAEAVNCRFMDRSV